LRTGTPRERSRAAAVGFLIFALALLVRIANFPSAFVHGVPQFPPSDDLYHAKRIAYSAAHPFRVLNFDPNRGPNGSFCPWPPLYDMLAGAAARALGGGTPVEALARAAWFPPLVASLVAAALAVGMTRRFGSTTGLLAGAGVALSVYFLDKSRLSTIDHHFLEFPLTLGIVAAVVGVARADEKTTWRYGAILGLALLCALLVQTALLLAAGAALLGVLLLEPRNLPSRAAAGLGFGLASAVLFLYRGLQPSGYPDTEWYLGTPHAAALLGAAAACAAQLWVLEKGLSRARSLVFALGIGALTIVAIPEAAQAMRGGSQFLAGDPWFRSISEFRPLFFQPDSVWLLDLCLLGGGALLTVPILLDRRWHDGPRRLFLLFAVSYLMAAISSRRFLGVAAPLLAVSGAVYFSDLRKAGHNRLAWGAAFLLLAPTLVLTVGRVIQPAPAVGVHEMPMVRAAEALALQDSRPGRVLPPWSWGHLFNVVSGRPVLVDNFGTMSGLTDFENATGITLATREKAVADYCATNGVRYIVLDDPLPYYAARAEMSGLPRGAFEIPPVAPRSDPEPSRLMRSTFWWRAYFEGGQERPGRGSAGAAFQRFRLIRVETAPKRSEIRSTVQVWEFFPPSFHPRNKTAPTARGRLRGTREARRFGGPQGPPLRLLGQTPSSGRLRGS
jgi:asparagine N-glycosylation enzyme membrane subunit Stt3